MARLARVTGGAETRRALADLARVIDGPMREAGRFALAPIVPAARKNLMANDSVITGELRKSLTVKADAKRSRKLRPVLLVGPDAKSKAVKYAHLVEFGTAPHPNGRRGFHPGADAHPFLAPAYEDQKGNAVKRFAQKIEPAIAKRVGRLAARKGKA